MSIADLSFTGLVVLKFAVNELETVGKEEKEVDHGDAWKCTWKLSSGDRGTHNLCIPTSPHIWKRLQDRYPGHR